jgi:hypothetical protein
MPKDRKDAAGPDLYRRHQFQDDYFTRAVRRRGYEVEEEESLEELMEAFSEDSQQARAAAKKNRKVTEAKP